MTIVSASHHQVYYLLHQSKMDITYTQWLFTGNNQRNPMRYNNAQLFWLIALRFFIGWHFLFEGLIKLFNPGWTSKGYLLSSQGIFSSWFTSLAESSLLTIANYLTIFVLIGVGLVLILGFLEKSAAFAGIGLLLLFYLSHPAWPGLEATGPVEGNYFLVNKNLIEIAALGVLAFFPTGHLVGLGIFRNPGKGQLAG